MYMTTSQSFFKPPTKQAPMQKIFGKPKPEREYKRFIKMKIADSGIDTQSSYKEFNKKDIIAPLERNFDDVYKHGIKLDRTDQWALSTVKTSANPIHIPKIQQYSDYYFPCVTEVEKINYNKSSNKSDHFSENKVPDLNQVTKKENKFLDFKSN